MTSGDFEFAQKYSLPIRRVIERYLDQAGVNRS